VGGVSTDTVIGAARRPGPANSHTDEDSGERWYVYEKYGRLLSVTTAFRAIAKMGLMRWAAQLAARHAFIELPTVVTASRTKACGRSTNRCRHDDWQTSCERCPCGACRPCVEKWLADRHFAESSRRSDEGIRTHDVIEWWSLHDGEYRPHDPDIAPYVAAFKAFAVEYGLTPDSFILAEGTVINMADRYAGTTDGILRFDACASEAAAKLVAKVLRHRSEYAHIKTPKAIVNAVVRDKRTVDLIVDWKTREGEKVREGEKTSAKFYPEQALQLAGYRWAPIIRLKGTEVEVPMPETDGGVIVQLRPDGVTPRLAVVDEHTYAGFLHALGLYLWLVEQGPVAIGAYTFTLARRDHVEPEPGESLDVLRDDDPGPTEPPPDEESERCPNCRAVLDDCDMSGCGQRRKPGWRTDADSDDEWLDEMAEAADLLPAPKAEAPPTPAPRNGSKPPRTLAQRVLGDRLDDVDIPF
jgi:hypothetical protein